MKQLDLAKLCLVCAHRNHVLEHDLMVRQLLAVVFLVKVKLLQLLRIHLSDVHSWREVLRLKSLDVKLVL